MVKYCSNCGEENPDKSNYCLNCGYPLFEIQEPQFESKNFLIVMYVITILLSWGGVIMPLLFKNSFSYFGFFGVFLPFFLIQSKKYRKHGLILLVISILGLLANFFILFYIFK